MHSFPISLSLSVSVCLSVCLSLSLSFSSPCFQRVEKECIGNECVNYMYNFIYRERDSNLNMDKDMKRGFISEPIISFRSARILNSYFVITSRKLIHLLVVMAKQTLGQIISLTAIKGD